MYKFKYKANSEKVNAFFEIFVTHFDPFVSIIIIQAIPQLVSLTAQGANDIL